MMAVVDWQRQSGDGSSFTRLPKGGDTARAVGSRTEEAAYAKPPMDGAALAGKVVQAALVATVNSIRCSTAVRTSRCCAPVPYGEDDRLGFDQHLLKLEGV